MQMQTNLKQILCLTAVIVVLLANAVSAEVVSKVAAVVNDSIITTYQLEKAFEKTLALNPGSENLGSAEKDKMRRQLLDKLIEEELVKERVKQLPLPVSDDDVEAAIQDVQNQNNLTRQQLQEELQQQGMDL